MEIIADRQVLLALATEYRLNFGRMSTQRRCLEIIINAAAERAEVSDP